MPFGFSWQRLFYLLIGLALFALALRQVDLGQVGRELAQLGPWGGLAVILVFLTAFVADTGGWLLTIPRPRFALARFYRLWRARMVGEAFNLIVPAGSLGGEPVKAVMLKRYEGIDYEEGGASVILQRSVQLTSMLVFFAVGLAIMFAERSLPRGYELTAVIGWGALCLGCAGFIAVQCGGGASRVVRFVARRLLARRAEAPLAMIESIEGHLRNFYFRQPRRLAGAFGATFLAWALNAAEVKLVLTLLGQPVSWAEAWMLTSLVELLRAGLFLIPAGLGAVEVGFVVLVEALTGQASLGLAVALVRRGREIFWIAWGLAIGWFYPPELRAPAAERAGAGES